MQLAHREQARQHSDQLRQKSTRPRLGPRIPYCRNCKGLLTPAQQYARSQKRARSRNAAILAQETRGKDHKQQTKESPRRSRHPASEKPDTISARTCCRSQAGADTSHREANFPMVGRRIRKLHDQGPQLEGMVGALEAVAKGAPPAGCRRIQGSISAT